MALLDFTTCLGVNERNRSLKEQNTS